MAPPDIKAPTRRRPSPACLMECRPEASQAGTHRGLVTGRGRCHEETGHAAVAGDAGLQPVHRHRLQSLTAISSFANLSPTPKTRTERGA